MSSASPGTTAPYDALLLLSFGGPEGPDDVLPFLQNVTRGRGIPDERLVEVGAHYRCSAVAARSTTRTARCATALQTELAGRGVDLPVLWGNRNWAAVPDRRAARRPRRRRTAACSSLTTSAYSSYSGCRQYREDLGGALSTLAAEGRQLLVDQVRRYFNTPGFVRANADAVLARRREARLCGATSARGWSS